LNAIILAAGEGKRLRPLTKNLPKCLVKLFGKALLEWQIEIFRNCNINDISVVTGYCGEKIKFSNINYFSNSNWDNTNMVESLFKAKNKLVDSVIVSYGDIIFESKIVQKIILDEADISVVIDKNWEKYWKIRFDDPLEDAESLKIDQNGFIINIGQKVTNTSEIQGQYIGLMKFQGEGIQLIKSYYEKLKNRNKVDEKIPQRNYKKMFMTDFLQGLIDEGHKIKAVPVNNGWLELDSIQDYEVYNKKISDGSLSDFFELNN